MFSVFKSEEQLNKYLRRLKRRMPWSEVDGPPMNFQDVTFNASDFFATLSMTWTVDQADVTTFRYMILGKLMIIWFRVVTTTVGGTVAGANLQLRIPAGKTPKKESVQTLNAAPAGAATEQCLALLQAGNSIITILRNNANWVLGTNNTDVSGVIVLETN